MRDYPDASKLSFRDSLGITLGKLLLLLLITTINHLKENIPYDLQYSLGNS